MEEIWRTIDWRPLYEVSNLGRVRNRKSGKILATNPTKSHKHPQVWLYSEFWNATEQYTLSYIVFNAFNENKVRWPKRIKHLDGDITNNKLNNLSAY